MRKKEGLYPRLFSILLAAVLLIAVFAAPAYAQTADLRLDRYSFSPGEEIKVHFVASPAYPANAWVGIIPSHIPHGDEKVNDQHDIAYQYLNKRTGGTLIFRDPVKPGGYDFRMHDTDNMGKEVCFVGFRVEAPGTGRKVPLPQKTASVSTGQAGWHLTNYSFQDASGRTDGRTMGSSSGADTRIYDIVRYKGGRNNIVISHDRYNTRDNKHLAGVQYQVLWTDPPASLKQGKRPALNLERRTLSSKSWKAHEQSVVLNQGMGVYFAAEGNPAAAGSRYIRQDMKTVLRAEKEPAPGSQGQTKTITINLGHGYRAIYSYEWRD